MDIASYPDVQAEMLRKDIDIMIHHHCNMTQIPIDLNGLAE